MELKLLTKDEYLNYYKDFKYTHFMQSPGFGEVYETRGYKVYYLAFFKKEKNVALIMAGKKNILNYSSFYAPRGILTDYRDKDTLKEVIDELKKFLKTQKALYFKMDPGIIIAKRNLNSEVIEEYETFSFIELLSNLGFKHRGFSFDLTESSEPRFTFRLNIESDETSILKGMNSYNRNILKKEFNELVITKNDYSKFPLFYDTMKDTALRESLYLPDISYYRNFADKLSKYNSSDLYVAEVDINAVIEKNLNKIKELENKINTLNSKEKKTSKDENTIAEANGSINKLNKEITELKPYKDQTLALSAVLTAKDNDKVWIVFGGNKDILKNLNVNYHLYWHVIKDAKANGYKIVDFFGTHGKPATDNPEYGLFLYKSKFGGDFVEFIGEFDLIINPLMNSILMNLVKLRRKLKRLI